VSSFLVLACSGPGAAEAIATSSLIGLGCAAGSIAATVAFLLRSRKMTPSGLLNAGRIVAVVFAALHPVWTFGTVSGDCGYTVRVVAPVVLLLHVGLLLTTLRAPKKET
jgi:hypothetical protein